MPRRQHLLGRCITRAILSVERASSAPLLARIISFFSILQLRLVKLREAVFAGLREEVWQYDDEEYKTSFAVAHRDGGLKSVGDMGYSGSVRDSPAASVFTAAVDMWRVHLGLFCDPG